jgi:hypothetical protein
MQLRAIWQYCGQEVPHRVSGLVRQNDADANSAQQTNGGAAPDLQGRGLKGRTHPGSVAKAYGEFRGCTTFDIKVVQSQEQISAIAEKFTLLLLFFR